MVNGIFTIPLPGPVSSSPDELHRAESRISEFVAGPENLLAAQGMRACLERTGSDYSPLVLYGPHGSGKSHLARGLAASWRQRFPDARVVCLAGSEFAQDYAAAQADQRLDAWRQQLRGAELLVVEDLGQLGGKRHAQQELLHTLDALCDRGALVVITARTLPTHWATLPAGLRSRLSAGLAVSLALPGPMTRRAILRRAAAARGIELSKHTIRRLADGLNASASELIAAVLEMEFKANDTAQDADPERLTVCVETRLAAKTPTLREIALRTAKYFGLKLSDLKSPSRQQQRVACRSMAMYLARQLTPSSFDQIGEYFGGRDHTTVIHGCRRTEELLSRDSATRQAVEELRRMLVDM